MHLKYEWKVKKCGKKLQVMSEKSLHVLKKAFGSNESPLNQFEWVIMENSIRIISCDIWACVALRRQVASKNCYNYPVISAATKKKKLFRNELRMKYFFVELLKHFDFVRYLSGWFNFLYNSAHASIWLLQTRWGRYDTASRRVSKRARERRRVWNIVDNWIFIHGTAENYA